jgi:hypothetical protein
MPKPDKETKRTRNIPNMYVAIKHINYPLNKPNDHYLGLLEFSIPRTSKIYQKMEFLAS